MLSKLIAEETVVTVKGDPAKGDKSRTQWSGESGLRLAISKSDPNY